MRHISRTDFDTPVSLTGFERCLIGAAYLVVIACAVSMVFISYTILHIG